MGNKQNKGASSTELTAKRNNLCHRLHLFKTEVNRFFLEIAMLKANTKYSEKGNCSMSKCDS